MTRSGGYWFRLFLFAGALTIGAALILLALVIRWQLDILLVPARMPIAQTPAAFDLPFESVTLTTRDNLQVRGWYIPGSRPEAIILIHGINTNRAVMLPTAAILAEAGFSLLLIDLRGHGQSDDSLNSYGYREAWDVSAGVDYLLARPDVERVAVLGTSLGGATVVRAAANDPRLAAVVVQTSYSSLRDAVEDAFDDFAIFPTWPFAPLIVGLAEWRADVDISQVDSARDLTAISPRPVLIIHNSDGQLFPLYHAHKMYRAAGQPKSLWLLDGLGHGDPALTHEDVYRDRIITFFEGAFAHSR